MAQAPSSAGTFLFMTCQIGAESALKHEIGRRSPDFRFAYSRPGFLTFKIPPDRTLAEDFDPQAVFARAWGWSLGKATAADAAERTAEVWRLAGDRRFDHLHVWQRDVLPAGEHGYEPALSPAANAAASALVASQPVQPGLPAIAANARAKRGDLVLNCVLVEPAQWWVGLHRALGTSTRWPGGLFEEPLPADAVSRAYLKMEEALAWSELPLARGDRVAEIGCAPGGASQALLRRGMSVVGIDPADVEPSVLAHPKFTHVRKRGADLRRREFRGVRWLVADMNVAPTYTLTTVEEIVTHPAVRVEGLLLTLKLSNWDLAQEVPSFVERVRSWGFRNAAARQLSHNRQEICLAARR